MATYRHTLTRSKHVHHERVYPTLQYRDLHYSQRLQHTHREPHVRSASSKVDYPLATKSTPTRCQARKLTADSLDLLMDSLIEEKLLNCPIDQLVSKVNTGNPSENWASR